MRISDKGLINILVAAGIVLWFVLSWCAVMYG